MPIREGKAKLWFNTKQEQDEFDDNMIASIVPQSLDPMGMVREKKQFFLDYTEEIKNKLNQLCKQNQFKNINISEYADKYHIGKRDHTYWRELSVQKFGLGSIICYLLLRELPIRNFYARSVIMFAFLTQFFLRYNGDFLKQYYLFQDEWNDKHIKNYGVYQTMRYQTPPTLDNKLPQEALWKLNQPGYQRWRAQDFHNQFYTAFPKKLTLVEWDGTFNMPLESLANSKHVDNKRSYFIYE